MDILVSKLNREEAENDGKSKSFANLTALQLNLKEGENVITCNIKFSMFTNQLILQFIIAT